MYTSSVAATTALPSWLMAWSKPAFLPMYQLMTVPKMCFMVSSLKSVKQRRLKWRSRRGVMAERPPPGGPMAATSSASSIILKEFSPRSYQPPWSQNWRSSSMGGCAPYFSTSGMLRSSTKMMHFMPEGGP